MLVVAEILVVLCNVGILINNIRCEFKQTLISYYFFFLLADCGEEINAGSGKLQSPNYPNKYPNNKDCSWIITASFGFNVALDFETFEVRYKCIKQRDSKQLCLFVETEIMKCKSKSILPNKSFCLYNFLSSFFIKKVAQKL